jgi:hypothetical protein
MVLGYACVATNNLEKATKFYDELLAPLGGKVVMSTGRGNYYQGTAGGGLLVTETFNGKPADPGNGNSESLFAGFARDFGSKSHTCPPFQLSALPALTVPWPNPCTRRHFPWAASMRARSDLVVKTTETTMASTFTLGEFHKR